MSNQFTPGPWKVKQLDPCAVISRMGSLSHQRICDTYGDDPEAVANARLIAASPALYDACKVAADALRIIDEHHSNEPNNTRLMLESALALVEAQP